MMAHQPQIQFLNTTFFTIAMAIVLAMPADVSAQEKLTLPFVSNKADIVMSSRPAKIMRSDDYRDLKKKGGPSLDKMASRMTDSYFKMSLAEIQDIDQIIYAASIPDMQNPSRTPEMLNVIVLKTVKNNETGFDMVTQDVKDTLDYKGKEYFEVKKPVNYMYRFVYIANDKTIVWGISKKSIESSIDAGTTGPVSAPWYESWREFSSKHFSTALNGKPLHAAPIPNEMSALKKVTTAAGGADIGKRTVAKIKTICHSSTEAEDVAEAVEKFLELARTTLESQQHRMKKQGQATTYTMLQNALAAAKVKTTQKTVEVASAFDLDFKALAESFEETHLASKRVVAANNLRQTVLAFHNFESAMGKFPSPVMVHESGKKYSWRIAILPYIGEKELYDQYDFNQEWNSAHNREVTARMPDVFRSDSDDQDSTNTSWFMLDGPDGIFNEDKSLGFADIKDGSSNTIIAVEAKRNVHWAKPEDIRIDRDRGLPNFGGYHKDGFNAAMADGSVRFISEKVDRDVLWQLYTASGGEVVDRNALDVELDDEKSD